MPDVYNIRDAPSNVMDTAVYLLSCRNATLTPWESFTMISFFIVILNAFCHGLPWRGFNVSDPEFEIRYPTKSYPYRVPSTTAIRTTENEKTLIIEDMDGDPSVVPVDSDVSCIIEVAFEQIPSSGENPPFEKIKRIIRTSIDMFERELSLVNWGMRVIKRGEDVQEVIVGPLSESPMYRMVHDIEPAPWEKESALFIDIFRAGLVEMNRIDQEEAAKLIQIKKEFI